MPHPAVQIYIWMCLALAGQMLDGYALAILAAMEILLSLGMCPSRFFYLLRRTRWILISLFVIFAYTGTGDLLWQQWGAFSPVTDGIVHGLLQLLRLLAMLAGLSILLSLLSQAQLIAGLYVMSLPFVHFGLSPERMAVRLALTLQYADKARQKISGNWRDALEQMLEPAPMAHGYIELQVTVFSGRDWLLVIAVTVALIEVWLLGVLQ